MLSSYEEQRDFEIWAFGKSPIEYDYGTMLTWNSRHGDLYFIRDDEEVKKSIDKMHEIYKEIKAIENEI